MGIEQFFSSIENNLATNMTTKFFNILENSKISADSLYIDFNSIVHNSSHKIISNLNIILYRIIQNRRDKLFTNLIEELNLPIECTKTPLEYKTYLTLSCINDLISDIVIQELLNMLTTMFKDLKKIFIAVDGVPSKGKMMEQKKRRYMSGVITKVQEQLLIKHETELKKNNDRYLFEKYKINWGKHNISPGTEFMDMMNLKLLDTEFTIKIRELQPQIKSYILSGVNEHGEGEKKFINHIKNNKSSELIAIYSPDSDVTLLAMLIIDCVKSCKLIRPNIQKKQIEVINIEKLCDNLSNYIKKKIKSDISNHQIILDIVFIFTMFGNDFLPKIESISVRSDFEYLLDRYAESFENPLIILTDKKYKLNTDQLIKLLGELQKNEDDSLQKAYMSANYRNYQQLKKILDAKQENFNTVLLQFLHKLQSLMHAIKHNDNIIKFEKDVNFQNQLKKITVMTEKTNNTVQDIKKYYKKIKKFPKFEIGLIPRNSNYNNFHKNNVQDSLTYLQSNVPITSYDIDLYKFNKMLDDYQNILNAHELELGKVSIDIKTMQWKADKISENIQKYYYSFFGITDMESSKMNKLLKHYMKGLIWVFNYYYNWYDETDNHTKTLTWFYKYSRAPLLTQLFNWCSNNKDLLIKITEKPIEYIPTKDFFNNITHLMRVSPAPYILDVIPNELLEFTKTYPYPNLDNVVINILNNKNDEIDCRGMIYLNKCLLKVALQKDAWTDKKFIEYFNKLNLLGKTIRLAGLYTDEPNINIIKYSKSTTIKKIMNKN